ncbi:MAG: hypothetical protein U9R32_00725, partial [Bacteroidota bacterium]|nr:hypothetical protein [Bacteroidota bacterium]
LSFCLDAKERKSQGLHKNIIHLFAMPKFGRVIFEQVLSFPVSLRHRFELNNIFLNANPTHYLLLLIQLQPFKVYRNPAAVNSYNHSRVVKNCLTWAFHPFIVLFFIELI